MGKAIIKMVIFPDNSIFFPIEAQEQSLQIFDAYSVIYPMPIILRTDEKTVLLSPALSVKEVNETIRLPIESDKSNKITAPIEIRRRGAISGLTETIKR